MDVVSNVPTVTSILVSKMTIPGDADDFDTNLRRNYDEWVSPSISSQTIPSMTM